MKEMAIVNSVPTAGHYWQHVAMKDKGKLKEAMDSMSAKEFTRIQKILGATEMDKAKALDEWAGILEGIKNPVSPEKAKKEAEKAKKEAEKAKKEAEKAKKEEEAKAKKEAEKAKKEAEKAKKEAEKAKKEAEKADRPNPFANPKGIKLTVDPELFAMMPRPSMEDYEGLKVNIKNRGLDEPIKVFEKEGEYIVWEGHTRYQVLVELGIEISKDHFVVVEVEEKDIVDRVLAANVARRHLTAAQKISIYKRYKPEVLDEIENRVRQERYKKSAQRRRKAEPPTPKDEEIPARAEDTPPVEEDKGVSARALKAKEIGVPEAELKYYDYLELWNPDGLKKELARGRDGKLYPLYQSTVEMEQYVKAHDPGAHKALKEDPSRLVEVYNDLIAKFGIERKSGPMETLVIEIQSSYERLIIKEHGALDFGKMTKFQKEFWGILERKKESYAKSGK